jgi:hypothetical protein
LRDVLGPVPAGPTLAGRNKTLLHEEIVVR